MQVRGLRCGCARNFPENGICVLSGQLHIAILWVSTVDSPMWMVAGQPRLTTTGCDCPKWIDISIVCSYIGWAKK